MKKAFFLILLLIVTQFSFTQDQWLIKAGKIDPSNYYGVSVANGMIGIVSSPEPFKVKDVVLAGAFHALAGDPLAIVGPDHDAA